MVYDTLKDKYEVLKDRCSIEDIPDIGGLSQKPVVTERVPESFHSRPGQKLMVNPTHFLKVDKTPPSSQPGSPKSTGSKKP